MAQRVGRCAWRQKSSHTVCEGPSPQPGMRRQSCAHHRALDPGVWALFTGIRSNTSPLLTRRSHDNPSSSVATVRCVSGLPIIPRWGRRIFPTHQRQGVSDRRSQPRTGLRSGYRPVFKSETGRSLFLDFSNGRRHERHARGLSISGIARELALDRNTARTFLRQTAWPRRAGRACWIRIHSG